MRRKLPLLFGAVFLAFAAGACEGPQGPAGPEGPQGPQGPQGPAGEDGQDGTNALNTCSDCHTSDATLVAIERQYSESQHGTGETFERDTNPCNACHTHQGFIANVIDGTTIDDVALPAPVNCRTCHQVHMTYEGSDFALTSTDAVTLMASAGTFDEGNGNLCANCHQARDAGIDLSGATAEITSFRAGYHHGTQANTISGNTAMDMGTFTVPAAGTQHAHSQSCTTCHMQEPYGAQAGGHTWDMRYIYHGAEAILVPSTTEAGCTGCHVGGDLTGITLQDDVQVLLDSAAVLLRAQGIMEAAPSTYANEATYDTDLVKAFLNFKLMEEDYSLGVHNPTYIRGTLNAVINYLNSL